MMKNKKITLAAFAAALAIGVLSVQYLGTNAPMSEEYGILTPASEEMDGIIISETQVPLGSEATEAATQHPYIQEVADLVNAEREKAGLAPLTVVAELNQAAGIRAEEIYTLFSHDRPDGSKYRTVLDQLGISYSGCGENVAFGYRTPQEVMSGWMGSEGHKANILNEKYTSIGIGYYEGANGYKYWSQMFAN